MRISLVIHLLAAARLAAGEHFFAGGHVGVSTLSADGATSIAPAASSASSYKPENGRAWSLFAGRHFTDYFSLQATAGANRNEMLLTSLQVAGGVEHSYSQPRSANTRTYLAEAMIYFRPRSSAIRPYLSAGPGTSRFTSVASTAVVRGGAGPPPAKYSSSQFAFRVAVGIDVRITGSLDLRYTFGETIQRNPISGRLEPPGRRNLANFQNLFGAAWRF